MKLCSILLFLLFPLFLLAQPVKISGPRYAKFIENTVVIKVKEEHRSLCTENAISIPSLEKVFTSLELTSIKKKFKGKQMPNSARNAQGQKLVDLSLIYELRYSSSLSVEKACILLKGTGLLAYAEPVYVPEVFYIPNDPAAIVSVQYYLENIKAFQGWDVSKGDTTIVIGITDTGTDPSHPDLQNIKHNYLDPIDGIDNDLDGYTDNFSGWDLGENDNNATYGANAHGVHVTGLAAASTDNALGIAGIGFKCKYLPVKIADANGFLTAAYDGIIYAADHGCKVINCSWGSTGGGQFGQDVVDYAVFNRDALVISAAGNDNKLLNFFPASYKHVMNVAATDSNDVKASFSNYGCPVDVTAPGADIYSTWVSSGYLYSGGTSMAAPITAGAAGIVRARFPGYTALQALEQIKNTSDSVYHVNPLYTDFLGRGRINLFRMLTETGRPGIDLEDHRFSDNANNVFSSGDTLRMVAVITNYLAASNDITIKLSSPSPYVEITDSVAQLSALLPFQSDSNQTDPFKIYVKPNAPTNALVRFRLSITDGTYSTSFCIEVSVNVDYINVRINDISTTITSRGKIGYNQNGQQQGLGFIYNDQANLLYESGLMVGTSTTKVSDAVRGITPTVSDRDFASVMNVREIVPAVTSEYDLKGVMNDDSAGISKLNIEITQHTYVWSSPGHTKYIILKYDLHNPGTIPIVNLYPGIFSDWDIQDPAKNKSNYDPATKMGYSYYSASGGLYAGVKLLTMQGQPHCYSLDNVPGGLGGVEISGGFSTSEKYTTLTTDRFAAGQTGTGTDVCQVVSCGPLVILPGDSVSVAFAMIAGENLQDLQTSANNAQLKYDELFPIGMKEQKRDRFAIGPNPSFGGSLYFSGDETVRSVSVFDNYGKLIRIIGIDQIKHGSLDISGLPAGMYSLSFETGSGSFTEKLILLPH